MTYYDILLTIALFFAPVIITFLMIVRARATNLVWLTVWGLTCACLVYRAYEFVHDIIFFATFMSIAAVITIWGLHLFIMHSIVERTRILSSVPTNMLNKAIKEACLDMKGEWICEYARKLRMKFGKSWFETGILRLKRLKGVYIEGRPDIASYTNALIVAGLFMLFLTYITYFLRDFYIDILGYSFYLPILSIVFSAYIAFTISEIRKDVLKTVAVGMITVKEKIKSAEKLYEILKMISIAESIKRKKAMEKIRKATEIAKALDIASKIVKKEEQTN